MKIHQFSAEEALASLKSRHEGLSQAEVQHRLSEYGANQVEVIRGESLILRFIKEFIHFFASNSMAGSGSGIFCGIPATGWRHGDAGLRDPRCHCHQWPVLVLATVSSRTSYLCLTEALAALRESHTGRRAWTDAGR